MAHPRTVTLYLVRHGETLWNAEGRLQGQQDVPLSETGREQARRLGERWRRTPLPFARGFTSDLSRAVETARLAAPALTLTSLPVLRERDFGSWEGTTTNDERSDLFDGETPEALHTRAGEGLRLLWDAGADRETILVVGHGGNLSALIAHALGLAPEQRRLFALSNTSVSILELRGERFESVTGRLLRLGDIAHLE
jgi:broad specificity phosphatase PhoE